MPPSPATATAAHPESSTTQKETHHTNTLKFTKSPWEDNGNGLIYGQCSGDDDEAPFVADVCNSPDPFHAIKERANARLIENAPELLEALRLAQTR